MIFLHQILEAEVSVEIEVIPHVRKWDLISMEDEGL